MRRVALVVEDEPDLQQVLLLALQRGLPGVEVRVADTHASGRAIVDELASSGASVELVLADHKVAGETETGLALLAHAGAKFPASARFLFTGQAAADVEESARGLGARVLWKPLRLASLMAEVQGAMARSG